MATLNSQGEIVPIEVSDPEETQIRKHENEPVTFPLTFTFAKKHSGRYGNGLIDVAEKFEFGACSI